MPRTPTHPVIALFAAFSFAAALIVSVFSVSHAPVAAAEPTVPCAEHHQGAPDTDLTQAACDSLCDSADADHLLAVPPDRTHVTDFAILAADSVTVEPKFGDSAHAPVSFGRGPPGRTLYLTTKRIRI